MTDFDPVLRPQKPLRGKRVLVAEDEPLLAMDIETVLRDAGAEVVGPAGSLSETMRLARAEGVDAAVLDVNLRGEEVYPAARLLDGDGVPILFHTAHVQPADLRRRFPNADILAKPASPRELLEGVMAVTSGS